MSKLIIEIVWTILFLIGMIVNCVNGSALLAALDGIIVGLGIGNCVFAYFKYMDTKKSKETSEIESKQD